MDCIIVFPFWECLESEDFVSLHPRVFIEHDVLSVMVQELGVDFTFEACQESQSQIRPWTAFQELLYGT